VPCVVYIALWIWILVYTSSLDLRIVFVVILLLWITHCGLTTRVEMAKKCSAFGCRSGYDSCADVEKRITFHSFPRDIQLREKWIKANPRKDFVPSKNSRMCSLHFRDDDFVEQHCDTNSSRRNQASSTELKKRYWKPDAVPSIFVNAPA